MTRAELHSRGDAAVSQLQDAASCPTCSSPHGLCWRAEHAPEVLQGLMAEAALLLRVALGRGEGGGKGGAAS